MNSPMMLSSSFRFRKSLRPRFAPSRLLLVLLAAGRLQAAIVPDHAEADLILGRPLPDATNCFQPFVAVDPTSQKIFVGDASWHRVLRFSSMASLQNGAAAEAVLGQPDFSSSAPGNGPARLNQPTALCCDSQGRLWVSDTSNNRVLRFDNAATKPTGASANGVLGQVNFNNSGVGLSASSFNLPVGLAADFLGNLYVADFVNHRVLRFSAAATLPNGASASAVLGQINFSSSDDPGPTSTSLTAPLSLALSSNPVLPASPYLWVADAFNNRIMLFSDAPHAANGAAAIRVLGQANMTASNPLPGASELMLPYSIATDSSGHLYAACYNRVLRFDQAITKSNGAPADGILGQSSFAGKEPGTGPGGLGFPLWLGTGSGGRLWICDQTNHRVLRHEAAFTKVNGADADGVIGAATTTTDLQRTFSPAGLAIDPVTGKLFVSDRAHHRVLRFASVEALVGGAAAEAVFGQPDFSGISYGTAPQSMKSPWGLAIDSFGNLWIADNDNHRILRFNNAAQRSSGVAADGLLGQQDFYHGDEVPVSASSVDSPRHLALGPAGELWVSSGNRVLRFDDARHKGSNALADGVLGQDHLGDNIDGGADARHFRVWGVAADPAGCLWVNDHNNHRIMRFDQAAGKADGATADGVFGHNSLVGFGTGGSGPGAVNNCSMCVGTGGRLWVADTDARRVLRWENAPSRDNGEDADGLIGQIDFGFNNPGCGKGQFSEPTAIVQDPQGNLWIADGANERVVRLRARVPRLHVSPKNAVTVTVALDRHAPGATYRLESSFDLVNWQTVTTFIAGANSPISFDVPKASGGRGYFRIVDP